MYNSTQIFNDLLPLYSRESQMKTLNIFFKILFIVQKRYKAVSLFNIISPTLNTSPPALTKCINSFRKKILSVVRATTHAPCGILLHQNGTSFIPLLLWVVQTHGNHLGQGLVSMVDEEDTQMQVCDCCNCCTGSVGPCIVMLQKDTWWQQSTLLWFDCRLKMIGDLSMMHWWQWSL